MSCKCLFELANHMVVRLGEQQLHRREGFIRRIQHLHPAHPCINGVRHYNVKLGEIMAGHYCRTLRRSRGPWAKELFVSLHCQSEGQSKHTRAIKAGSLVVGAIVLFHGAEIDTVGERKVGVVEQRRFAPTGLWCQSVESSRQLSDDVLRLQSQNVKLRGSIPE